MLPLFSQIEGSQNEVKLNIVWNCLHHKLSPAARHFIGRERVPLPVRLCNPAAQVNWRSGKATTLQWCRALLTPSYGWLDRMAELWINTGQRVYLLCAFFISINRVTSTLNFPSSINRKTKATKAILGKTFCMTIFALENKILLVLGNQINKWMHYADKKNGWHYNIATIQLLTPCSATGARNRQNLLDPSVR